ncbi:response regulator [Ferrovibrio sp.]|uniref:response regulator n=1 Tax=Ferrovibrio sp. TaxID=1917215 RepID=UPI003D0A4CBF
MARILLVDDDPLLRKVLKSVLELHNHHVIALDEGRKALQVFSPEEIDLVITDLVMPEIDGLEFIIRLRKNYASIPILALSGGGRSRNMEVLDQAGAFGANATLQKPFLPEKLLETVRNLLENQVR